MIVSLAVSKPSLLVVAMTQKRLLAFSTNKMLDMPMLAESRNNTFLNRTTTGTADGNAHSIMALEAVKLILKIDLIKIKQVKN